MLVRRLVILAAVLGVAAGCSDPAPLGPHTTRSTSVLDVDNSSTDSVDADPADSVETDTLTLADIGLDSASIDTLDLEWFGSDAADSDVVDDGAAGAGPMTFDSSTDIGGMAAESLPRVAFRILTSRHTLRGPGAKTRLRTIAISGRDTVRNSSYVRWASNAPGIASVSGSGVVTARRPGAAAIIARYAWHGRTHRATVVMRVLDPSGGGSDVPRPDTTPTGGPPAAEAELPRVILDVPVPERTGRVLQVRGGGDLQAAIDSAEYGDEVSLEAGATFVGNFRLRAKHGTGWITIRSSAAPLLPPPGTRVTPGDARQMATIETPNVAPAIRTSPGARNYRLIGLEVTASAGVRLNYGLVEFGYSDARQASLDEVPSWLVIDRSWLHGHDRLHLKRCLSFNSASSAVVDSRLEACHGRGQDTQAIAGWNGPGPFKIVNNYLADAAEVIMFGGANSAIRGLIPADIEIRHNHVQQSEVMRHNGWLVKNLLELKTAERVLIADNVVEHVWPDGQIGFAFNLKSDGYCSWCVTRNVTIRGNHFADAAGGIVLSGVHGGQTEPMHHVTIRDNVFERLGLERGTAGWLLELVGSGGSMTDLIVEQNTGEAPRALIMMDGAPTVRLWVQHNAFGVGYYGVKGSSAGVGSAALARYAPGGSFTANALVGARASDYPAGNIAVSSFADVPARAGDGVRVGADQGSIDALVTAVRAGQ